MTTAPQYTPRAQMFREEIAMFIEEQREAKQKAKKNETDIASKYDYTTWLANAADQASKLQPATHVLKAIHPAARGSNLYVPPQQLPAHREIGTHLLGEDFAKDAVGSAAINSAAPSIFGLLARTIEDRSLLDWIQAGDPDLRQALHPDAAVASGWMEAFRDFLHNNHCPPTSHTQAKQVYWLIGDNPAEDSQYHLLQPLFSSSLAHRVYTELQDSRFGEANTHARRAYRDKHPFDGQYREYRNLIAQKLGGTKPQNISQRNSERGGMNYLLNSLPPTWKQTRLRPLLDLDSALDRFTWFEDVKERVQALCTLLLANAKNNNDTRQQRKSLEQALGLQLGWFGACIHSHFQPGWTRAPTCRLPLCEQLWLDPERTELPPRQDHIETDTAFNAAYHADNWPDEVAGRFANWVNHQLRTAGLAAVGDTEYKHWAKQAVIDTAWPNPMQHRAAGGHV